MVTDLPKYMKEILRFDVSTNGIWNSVPYAAMWIVSMSSGWLCDWLIQKGYMTITGARKFFTCFGWFKDTFIYSILNIFIYLRSCCGSCNIYNVSVVLRMPYYCRGLDVYNCHGLYGNILLWNESECFRFKCQLCRNNHGYHEWTWSDSWNCHSIFDWCSYWQCKCITNFTSAFKFKLLCSILSQNGEQYSGFRSQFSLPLASYMHCLAAARNNGGTIQLRLIKIQLRYL